STAMDSTCGMGGGCYPFSTAKIIPRAGRALGGCDPAQRCRSLGSQPSPARPDASADQAGVGPGRGGTVADHGKILGGLFVAWGIVQGVGSMALVALSKEPVQWP